jgi:hypothetical protein
LLASYVPARGTILLNVISTMVSIGFPLFVITATLWLLSKHDSPKPSSILALGCVVAHDNNPMIVTMPLGTSMEAVS